MTTTLSTDPVHAGKSCLSIRLLDAALREVEPGAVLVPPWLLQNVIALDRGLGGSPFTVPHRKIHVIDRKRLLRLAHHDGMVLPDDLPNAPTLILLARAESDWLAERPGTEVLRYYWQLLFHARIDADLCGKFSDPSFDREAIESRIERIGRSAFNEAKFVLGRERYLSHNADPCETYAEFAAVYLELHYFQPRLLPVYFPAIGDAPAVLQTLAIDVDADDLLRRTRPSGADDDAAAPPSEADAPQSAEAHLAAMHPLLRAKVARDARQGPRLLARAERAAALGNVVRAAILRKRVFRASPHDKSIFADAMRDLDLLIDRLQKALEWSDAATHDWRASLRIVLSHAASGWRNPEDRLLYDLQKVCIYHERQIYSTNVIEWLLEFGRRPLRRPQPNQQMVLMTKSLNLALHRIPKARLTPPQRAKFAQLLHDALHHIEGRLHDALRPAITQSLEAGGLSPRNAVEQVAGQKLTEELIDGLTYRGFLTMGNVRDAISRNQIKFDDLHTRSDFLKLDPLLRIDRRLSDALDGVYHRGELYVCFFLAFSSLMFATRIRRFFTRTVLMPLAGAFIFLEAFDHTLFLLIRKLTGWHWFKLSRLDEFKHEPLGHFLLLNLPFVILAVVLLGSLNWPAFRAAVGRSLKLFFKGLGIILIDAPRWIVHRSGIGAVVKSRAFRLSLRFVAKPLIFALLAILLVPRGATNHARWVVLAGVFSAVNVLLNSRPGRALEQAALHWLRVIGARVTHDILGNLLRGVSHFFERRLEDVDRMLYAVDEWLRFRAGQPKSAFILKAGLGVFWFYIAYFTRFAVNLLVEPQINPIKHFPVVTVSHKIVLPTVGLFAQGLEQLGIRTIRARTLAAAIVTVIPGIFGFLAWELRANWKLYRANRPRVLKPVPIGSHGESMGRLLRPGFHSGTVPKIFARLRRAHRHFDDPGRPGTRARAAVHKQTEAAEHVREAVSHFIEREFIARVNQHPAWQSTPLSPGPIALCATRIIIDLHCPALDAAPARIFFEQRSGWIVSGIDRPGWMRGLPPAPAELLNAALLGLYKIACVDVVKEQVESRFAPEPICFDLSPEALTVWPSGQFGNPLRFNLRDPVSTPSSPSPLLRPVSIEWDRWVAAWASPGTPLLPIRVLPPGSVVRSDELEGSH